MQNSRQAYINLTLATLAFAVAFVAWSLISPIAKQLQTFYALDNTARSFLVAVPVILGSLLRIPLGILTDRFGGRKVFTALLLFTLVPVAGLGFANSFGTYILGAFFLGTAGASFAVGVPFVNRWFTKDKQGMALGIYGMGNIGTAVATFSMPALSNAKAPGGSAFWYYLVPIVIMAALFWLFARDMEGKTQPVALSAMGTLLRNEPIAWLFSLFYFLTFGCFVAMSNYLPTLLQEWFKMSATDAGQRAAGFAVVATLARPVGGWLSDKFGGNNVLTAVLTAGPLGALALAWVANSPTVEGATIFFLTTAVGLGLGNGAVFKLVAQHFPKNTGLVTGIAGCAGGLGGFFPPLVLGAVKDNTQTYTLGFVFLAVFAALCLGAVLWLRRQKQMAPQPA